ncbi:MAG: single-stranded DNA-binding protein [Candidatus Izimaplasma sp.]|nr:single-stranded DNA-binding protein [Candidatus Izimaplasma bacterium]
MKRMKFEIKKLDDALEYASKQLRLQPKYIDIEVVEKKGLIIKSYIVEATVNVDPGEFGFEMLTTMFETMQIDASIEMKKRNGNEIRYDIQTNENAILIGKGGKTLEHIQYYIRNLINSFSDERKIVLVDIGGYKANRKKQLEIIATKTAKKVARSKIKAKLDPMNAYERRIIHTKLAEWRDVRTESEGQGKARKVVIIPTRK